MSSEDSTELPIPNDGKDDKELCPVCCESEIRTRFLPCIHIICEPCLQNLIKCSEGNTFKCPLCRKEYYVDTFAPVKSRQYGEQNNHYEETSFSSQRNLTTISERVQNADRRLADWVIRSHNDSRINQRPHTYSNNGSERFQNARGRRLADRVIRSLNDSRINQRPQTYSNNESGNV
ncbi:E3 ubiquitin ligase TRIM40-like [Ruditapes philippinarum]|uniref:E3 ubiquitin ligase TRIM40-like n=1 Tax=Ruditapes philippinarum TaxID=129788 RepID=UPI00295BA96A|nr:E3 ubiquitin ligase TRIM40-like [Ruditapes philippinarum]